MNFRLLNAIIATTACAVLVVCNKTAAAGETSPPTAAIQSQSPSREGTIPTRLEWNLASLVGAYEKIGRTNAAWDKPATLALTEFARSRSGVVPTGEDSESIISNNCIVAVNAGCDDPMIRYLHIRYWMNHADSKQAILDAYCNAAEEMDKTLYPRIRKFYAWQRASQQVNSIFGYGPKVPVAYRQVGPWYRAEANLCEALSERTVPPGEIYDACHETLDLWDKDKKGYSRVYHEFEERFPSGWTNEPMLLLLRGEAYVHFAWDARGSGWANTVSNEVWQKFGERLAVAESALTRAWELNPKEPRIAYAMMPVELGQGKGRDRMEFWFQRAMKLNTNYAYACYSKLYYLEPKWYGSVDDMLAFGRECVHSTNWGGHVPLMLLEAHQAIQREYVDDSRKANYWKQPDVWQDLKAAFDRFFQLNPTETSWYNNYALYAYKAERWDALSKIIPKIVNVNYECFGDKEDYDKMVAETKTHVGVGTAD